MNIEGEKMNIEQFKKADKYEGSIVRLNDGVYYWLVSWDEAREVCEVLPFLYTDDAQPNYDNDRIFSSACDFKMVGISLISFVVSPDIKETEDLDDIVIWNKSICFGDIYNNAPEDAIEKIDDMSFVELLDFINSNEKRMEKELESGLMTSWDVVARTLWENMDLPEQEED